MNGEGGRTPHESYSEWKRVQLVYWTSKFASTGAHLSDTDNAVVTREKLNHTPEFPGEWRDVRFVDQNHCVKREGGRGFSPFASRLQRVYIFEAPSFPNILKKG